MPEFYARKLLPKWSSCLSGQKTNKLLNVQEGFLGFLFITAFRTIRIISNADVDVAEIKGDKHTKTTLHALLIGQRAAQGLEKLTRWLKPCIV